MAVIEEQGPSILVRDTPQQNDTSPGFWTNARRRLRRDRVALAGIVILLFMVVVILAAPILPLDDPTPKVLNTAARLKPPFSIGHLLGTDQLGRDVLSRLIWGAQRSLIAGILSVAIAFGVGFPIGLISGFFHNWASELLMRIVDLLMSFPAILLAILVVSVLGPGLFNAMIAVGIVGIPFYARLVRASVLTIKHDDYFEAARALGSSSIGIMVRHIIPNTIAPIIVAASFDIGVKILATASLSFLGLGTQPPEPDWGNMLAEGRSYVTSAPYLAVIPGLAIFIVVVSANMVGDGLRDALDPTMKDL